MKCSSSFFRWEQFQPLLPHFPPAPSPVTARHIPREGGGSEQGRGARGRALSPSLALPAEDTVFLRDEDERCEYVLSQQGLIYQGARDYITSTPWNFGQVSGAWPPRTPGTPSRAQPVQPWRCRAQGLVPRVCPRTRAPDAASTSGRLQPRHAAVGQTKPRSRFQEGNAVTWKHGRARGAFLHGSWGPRGCTLLIGVATLRREPAPDNALPGTVPAAPIRQRPCPELQPPAAALGPSARGALAALAELRAVRRGAGLVGAGMPMAPAGSLLRFGEGL